MKENVCSVDPIEGVLYSAHRALLLLRCIYVGPWMPLSHWLCNAECNDIIECHFRSPELTFVRGRERVQMESLNTK